MINLLYIVLPEKFWVTLSYIQKKIKGGVCVGSEQQEEAKSDILTVIKRDGRVVGFDGSKIFNAMLQAYNEVYEDSDILREYIELCQDTIDFIEGMCTDVEGVTVEDIQDEVERQLMDSNYKEVARAYIVYRNKRSEERGNIIDRDVDELVCGDSEYWTSENANKDSKLVTTQRDYLAGIVSTDLARRKLLPSDVVEAHDKGLIHNHKKIVALCSNV